MKSISQSIRISCLSILVVTLTACATDPSSLSNPEQDPWEPLNRKMYSFNMAVDKAIVKPIAKGYDKVTPTPLKNGIRNALRNLGYPAVIINLALQGKLKESAIGTGRFLFNSTFGILGLVDVATDAGMPDYDEDFGQTLAVWGVKRGPYLMLPVLGPSTITDGIGRLGNSYAQGDTWLIRHHNQWVPYLLDGLDARARLLPQEGVILDAPDPYSLIRDAYLQQREYEIYDGDPPLPDYEDFYEDYEE